MASTYSSRLKLELIGSGEQSNSWGNTTNNTLSRSLEEAIAGVLSINLGSASSPLTLTSGNGPVLAASNQARSAAIRFHSFTSAFTINFPAVEKIYYIINDGTGNGTLTLDVGGTGSAANQQTLSPGQKLYAATDGTTWYPLETSSSTWRTVSASSDNVFAGENIFVNTSSNTVNLTLPTTPPVGSEIRFMDLADNFDSNALTLTPGGSDKVFGAASAGTVSTEGAAFSLVYTGATYGWKITEK